MAKYRKYELNHNFFDTWSRAFAYILGFVTADGSVNKYTLSIQIHKKDIDVLYYIGNHLFPNKDYVLSHRNGVYVGLRANSTKLVSSLNTHGIIPAKSMVVDFPSIPNEYLGDYIRGVFDGDGWITQRRNLIETGIASGSKNFLDGLLKAVFPIHGRIRCRGNWYVLDFNLTNSILLRELMYRNEEFALSRKKIKFWNYHTPSPRFWTKEQENFLLLNLDKNDRELAITLGKSVKAIGVKKCKLKKRLSTS